MTRRDEAGTRPGLGVVQVTGLSRWVLFVPDLKDDALVPAHRQVRAVTRASAPRWMAYLGCAAAALIATGVVVPLGLDIARLTNFAGYVSWCARLVAMAVVLWRAKPHADGTASATATTRHRNPRALLTSAGRRRGNEARLSTTGV